MEDGKNIPNIDVNKTGETEYQSCACVQEITAGNSIVSNHFVSI